MKQFEGDLLPQNSATSQLIWRDFFYTMASNNKNFGQMEDNPACISIPWNDIEIPENKRMLECWKNGKTGYPFIDAGMRQLMQVPKFNSFVYFNIAAHIQIGISILIVYLGRMDSSRGTEFVGMFFDKRRSLD